MKNGEFKKIITQIKSNSPAVYGSPRHDIFLDKESISNEEADELWDALEYNTSVTGLTFNNCKISSDSFKNITKLKSHEKIQIFSSWNSIGEKDVEYICSWLKLNNSVERLKLEGGKIGKTGANYIGEMLQINTKLKYLHLSFNTIGYDGLAFISHALTKNNYLETIDIAGNNIGDKGAATLMRALESNNKVSEIVLDQNKITNSSTESIKHMILNNNTIDHLSLVLNFSIRDHNKQEIQSMLKDPGLMEQRTKNFSRNIASLNFMHQLSTNTKIKPDIHFGFGDDNRKKTHKPNPRSGV